MPETSKSTSKMEAAQHEPIEQDGRAFPDYKFDLPLRKLVGTDVTPVFHAGRVGAVVRELVRTCKREGVTEFSQLDEYDSGFRENRLKRAHSYLAQKITVINPDTGKNEITRRRNAADEEETLSCLLQELEQQNHPVAQVLDHVRSAVAETDDEENKSLTDGDLKALVRDVLTITYWKELRPLYEANVAHQRGEDV